MRLAVIEEVKEEKNIHQEQKKLYYSANKKREWIGRHRVGIAMKKSNNLEQDGER
jgi:hypothetical protein